MGRRVAKHGEGGDVGENGVALDVLTDFIGCFIKKSSRGGDDFRSALKASLEQVIAGVAGQIAMDVARNVLGDRDDVVVLAGREAVNRNVLNVFEDIALSRSKLRDTFESLLSGARVATADDGQLLESAKREILKLKLRVAVLEGHLRGYEIDVPPEEECDGPEYDLFSRFENKSRQRRDSKYGDGILFDARDDEEEVSGKRGSSHGCRFEQGVSFGVLEKMQAELAELKVVLGKAIADRDVALQQVEDAKEESKGLRNLLARRETTITLLKRADTIVPELEDAMREVDVVRGRLNCIVRAVRDGLDGKEPLGFFGFAEIERVMDTCAGLLRKIDDVLVINFEGYVDASLLYAEVLGDVALNDGIPNYALFAKVNRLRGMLEGVLSFQNQFLREQTAERMAHKEASKTTEVPDWWGWKAHDAEADAECNLVDFMSLLDVKDFDKLRELVQEGDTQKIRNSVLKPVLKRFHPDRLAGMALKVADKEQVESEANEIMRLLARIERDLLADVDVLNFYLKLYELNIDRLVTWEQVYPAMAAFLKLKRS